MPARNRSPKKASDPTEGPLVPPDQDLTLLFNVLAAWSNNALLSRLADEGFGDLRQSHGYIFQHLVVGPTPVTALAEKLGMTAQGASKAVNELEALGYVTRAVSGDDRRTRLVELTERGRAAITASRLARVKLNQELRQVLGERDARALVRSLQRLARHHGGLEVLAQRRLRAPR